MDGKNKLYFGDNLKILREYVTEASVDLIYLDPPFNPSATYNVLFKKDVAQGPLSGPAAFQVFPAAQITTFGETYRGESHSEFNEIVITSVH
jgi:site-specific DNA-methyltransferase (adenine-specific)